MQMTSLRAFRAPWRLPQWPTRDKLLQTFGSELEKWSCIHRVPVRVSRLVSKRIPAFVSNLCLPERPEAWATMETYMGSVVREQICLVQDDRDMSKLWGCEPGELIAGVMGAIVSDPEWSVDLGATPGDLQSIGYARALAGLPPFLRPSQRTRRTHPPYL